MDTPQTIAKTIYIERERDFPLIIFAILNRKVQVEREKLVREREMEESIASLCRSLASFSNHLESSCDALTQSLLRRPIPLGTHTLSLFLSLSFSFQFSRQPNREFSFLLPRDRRLGFVDLHTVPEPASFERQ